MINDEKEVFCSWCGQAEGLHSEDELAEHKRQLYIITYDKETE